MTTPGLSFELTCSFCSHSGIDPTVLLTDLFVLLTNGWNPLVQLTNGIGPLVLLTQWYGPVPPEVFVEKESSGSSISSIDPLDPRLKKETLRSGHTDELVRSALVV